MEKETVSLGEWKEKGMALFGKDEKKWIFICPICETKQSIQDFLDYGISEEIARKTIGISCIGRNISNSQIAIGRSTPVVKGKPCNYAGYGLFKLNPIHIKTEDGYIVSLFNFENKKEHNATNNPD